MVHNNHIHCIELYFISKICHTSCPQIEADNLSAQSPTNSLFSQYLTAVVVTYKVFIKIKF